MRRGRRRPAHVLPDAGGGRRREDRDHDGAQGLAVRLGVSALGSQRRPRRPVPARPPGEYCLTDFVGAELQCYPDYATAQAAYKSLDTKVTETTWCITAPQPTTPDASATPTPTASPKKSRSLRLAVGLARAPRPTRRRPTRRSTRTAPHRCRATSRPSRRPSRARRARRRAPDDPLLRRELAGTGPRLLHDPERGRRAAARDRPAAPARADRQDRAPRGATDDRDRDAERPALRVDPADLSDRRRSRPRRRARATPRTRNEVWYPDEQRNKVHLGPVTITGGNITNARASLQRRLAVASPSGRSTSSSTATGTDAFANATRLAVNAAAAAEPDRDRGRPHDHLEPGREQPDHGGQGRDHRQLHRAGGQGPRLDPERRFAAGEPDAGVGADRQPDAGLRVAGPGHRRRGRRAGPAVHVPALLLPDARRRGVVRHDDLGDARRSP